MSKTVLIDVNDRPPEADIILAEHESLSELTDELDLILGGSEPGEEIVVDLHPSSHAGFSVTEAFAAVVDLVEASNSDSVRLRCVVSSEKVREFLASYLPQAQREPVNFRIGKITVRVRSGDIARTLADAIVNASNTQLKLGGGVSGAIRRAAKLPEALQAAMSALAPIGPGDVVHTRSFGMPMTGTILHVATASGREPVIARALTGILEACSRLRIAHVAIPALGAGTGGLPLARCAELTRNAIAEFAKSDPATPKIVDLVLLGARATQVFVEVFQVTSEA